MEYLKVGSIRQIHRQLLSNGICVGEYALRQWVKSGAVPATYVGKKAFISYQEVVNFLTRDRAQSAG